jgi:hypothetical protein
MIKTSAIAKVLLLGGIFVAASFAQASSAVSETAHIVSANPFDSAAITTMAADDASTPSLSVGESAPGTSTAYVKNGGTVYAVDLETGALSLMHPLAAKQVTAASPSFSPAGGKYQSLQLVTLSASTPSAQIYYTTNGSTPTTTSTLYRGSISVPSNLTIKAIAVAKGYANSSVASASYTVASLTWPASGSSLGKYHQWLVTTARAYFGPELEH